MIELHKIRKNSFQNHTRIMRDGVEVEKGVVITNDWLERNEELLKYYWGIFSAYPDKLLELMTPAESNFKLYPYQVLFLRSIMRYTKIYITAARATSKTFLSILGKYIQCVVLPNHVGSIVAPAKSQAAKISKQKIEEIWRIWPLLEKEVEKALFGKDYVDIYFKNGSRLSIVAACI